MVPAIMVDILGERGLANGLGVSGVVEGTVTSFILPAAGEYWH